MNIEYWGLPQLRKWCFVIEMGFPQMRKCRIKFVMLFPQMRKRWIMFEMTVPQMRKGDFMFEMGFPFNGVISPICSVGRCPTLLIVGALPRFGWL